MQMCEQLLPSQVDLQDGNLDLRELFHNFHKWVLEEHQEGRLRKAWTSLDREHRQSLVKFVHNICIEKVDLDHRAQEVLSYLKPVDSLVAVVLTDCQTEEKMQYLTSRSDQAFEMLTGLLQTAVSTGECDKNAIEQVRVVASEKYRAADSTRYIILGGLVSAGKTTLVNAFVRFMLPELQTELKESPGLLPTDYNENTAIVTEVRLSPTATSITTTLMRAIGGNTDDGDGMPTVNLETSKREFEPAPGYPQTYPNSGSFRKLQKDIKSVIEKKSETESTMMRLVIEIPCAEVGTNPLSIIDTPGLDSPLVWQQVREEVSAKAFVLVWVGALDSPAAFGMQGPRLVELYYKTGHLLPPVLAGTKWDLLKEHPNFSTPESRVRQAQRRINELRAGLNPKGVQVDVIKITCSDPSDLTSIRDAMDCVTTSADTSSVQWSLTKSVAIAEQIVPKGCVLKEVRKDMKLICNPNSKVDFLEDMLQFQLPVTLKFTAAESEMPVMLATTDAPGFLAGREKDVNVTQLWSMLQKLLRGAADPMRLSKRLTTTMAALQQAMNILLRTDPAANVCREKFEKTKPEAIKKFSASVDAYFFGFPAYITQARFEDMKKSGLEQREQSQVCCLKDYMPPRGLSSDECAICQLPRFIHAAHEDTKAQRDMDRHAYVKTVAKKTIELWHRKYLENIHRYEKECEYLLPQTESFKEGSLNDEHDSPYWNPTGVQQQYDRLGGVMAGAAVCCFIAAMPMLAGKLRACGVISMSLGAIALTRGSLPDKNGLWRYEAARQDATQSVLDILNKDSFQASVKKDAVESFALKFDQSMKLANSRSMDNSIGPESITARKIRQEVEESILLLRQWFARFVSQLVTSDNPWIAPPPEELLASQLEDDGSSSASDTEYSEQEDQ